VNFNWGAIALGAMTGLGAALIAFLLLGVTGVVDSANAAVPAVFLQFLAQLVAGYVAARFAGRDAFIHGSFAALALYVIGSTITLAANPGEIGSLTLILFAIVAAVVGGAGGLLGDGRRRA
jgi:putative membrane protein (TIGR04086 family)